MMATTPVSPAAATATGTASRPSGSYRSQPRRPKAVTATARTARYQWRVAKARGRSRSSSANCPGSHTWLSTVIRYSCQMSTHTRNVAATTSQSATPYPA
jgi:hypothetical protein